ncbi:hypothetical protein [Butyrivibrio sp. INlla16]|uniref:hypothetical protein n=1 Tax=Butyrivibrio sp. INlla16 TaxID=1520807 RepID=UPI00088673F8|nr:hypothetical protein [Butyrivibrio sp. INlla16]SDB13278.1 hypothetical protein SAMN02910263_00605 [Butyrivibrio sp. INlla16]
MKKNEKAFLVNVMWVPLFAALMTVALSKAPGVNPYFVGALMGAIGAALCYWDYRVFMKKASKDENEA